MTLKHLLTGPALCLVVAIIFWRSGLKVPAIVAFSLCVALAALSFFSNLSSKVRAALQAFGGRLGQIVSTIFLFLIYITLFTPIAIVRRLFGSRIVVSVFEPEKTSYWVSANEAPMPKEQFIDERSLLRAGLTSRSPANRLLAWTYVMAASVSLVIVLNYAVGYVLWHRDAGTWKANPILKRFHQASAALYPANSSWVDSHVESLARTRQYDWSIFGKLSKDWKSPSINIENRNRRTWSPPVFDREAKTVFFFGGSAAWGWGQRDEFTIPSVIAKHAFRDGSPLHVINYARIGWTAWEEISFLTWLLATGAKPDYVVFYDGFNDLTASKEEDLLRDGYPLRIDEREYRLVLENPPSLFSKSYSALARVMDRPYRGFESDPSTRNWAPVELTEDEKRKVRISSDQCLSVLAARAELLARLAESYHFRPLVFFQPDIFTKHPVAPEEGLKLLGERHASVLAAIRKRTRSALPTGTIDLASVLDGDTPVLVDLVHTNEAGAEIIGRAIYDRLRPYLESHRTPPQ